jgi:hypothetical protein
LVRRDLDPRVRKHFRQLDRLRFELGIEVAQAS